MTQSQFGNKIIYTTGAYLIPLKGFDGKWYWSVSGFNDDTFEDGDIFNPAFLSSEKLEDLETTSDELYNEEYYSGHGFNCDNCKKPMSEFNYSNSKGLCFDCIEVIN